MTTFEFSDRLKKLPPYLFEEIDKLKNQAKARGDDLVDLGIGDPDIPTYSPIVKKLQQACDMSETHRYPSYRGEKSFCEAAAKWYEKRFNVAIDPETEIVTLIGAKEGIGHIPLAFVNPGDSVLIPDPGYPVYFSGTLFAGGNPVWMPLLEKNQFYPDFDSIEKSMPKNTKLMWISYPNNPTTAVAELDFFEKAVSFAKKHNIIICHDAAYTEITYNGYEAPSILQIKGAKDCAIEFQSMSKTFNMTGWRIGFAIGNSEIIKGLAKVKVNLDSGVFSAIQYAAIEALQSCEASVKNQMHIYEKRRDMLVDALNSTGLKVRTPKGTIYIWTPVPKGFTSESFVKYLLIEKKILVAPGNGYGKNGEGYFRISLTCSDEGIKKACDRFASLKLL